MRDARPIRFWRFAVSPEKFVTATAILDSTGFFAVSSSYGAWCFHWGGANGDFRKFFSGCPGEYIASKLEVGNVYDGEATLEEVKRVIVELRREGGLSRERAREMWDALEEDHNHLGTEGDFGGWLNSSPHEIEEPWFLEVRGHSHGMQGLIKSILPSLQASIRADYEEECAATEAKPAEREATHGAE